MTNKFDLFNDLFKDWAPLQQQPTIGTVNGDTPDDALLKVTAINERSMDDCIKEAVVQLAVKWRMLDQLFVTPQDVDASVAARKTWVSIPQHYDYRTFDRSLFPGLSHPRIPERVKVEYLEELTQIFESVPRVSSFKRKLEVSNLSTIKRKAELEANLCSSTTTGRGYAAIPELLSTSLPASGDPTSSSVSCVYGLMQANSYAFFHAPF